MEVLFYSTVDAPADWLSALQAALPQARIRVWQAGDEAPADYAVVWKPPPAVLEGRAGLKAVFNLGAGIDAILTQLARHPQMLPVTVPLIRLEDAGMARQMVQYAVFAVLEHFRRFDDYAIQQRSAIWRQLPARSLDAYPVGVLGAGRLGAEVAVALRALGFELRIWRRSPAALAGMSCYAGEQGLAEFAQGLQVVVNLLPLTPDTAGVLDARLFARLAAGARVVNVARGAHLVEADLLAALASGQVGSAVLDVFPDEPLPVAHPFWNHPRIRVTPHVAALTLIQDSVEQIAAKIARLECGETVSGIVDRGRGY